MAISTQLPQSVAQTSKRPASQPSTQAVSVQRHIFQNNDGDTVATNRSQQTSETVVWRQQKQLARMGSSTTEGDVVGGSLGLGSAGFNGAALVAGGPAAWTGAAVFTLACAGWDYNKSTRIAVCEL